MYMYVEIPSNSLEQTAAMGICSSPTSDTEVDGVVRPVNDATQAISLVFVPAYWVNCGWILVGRFPVEIRAKASGLFLRRGELVKRR